MSNAEFIKRATAAVVDYFNRHVDVTDNFELTAEDTFVVWSCKTLQDPAKPQSSDLYHRSRRDVL